MQSTVDHLIFQRPQQPTFNILQTSLRTYKPPNIEKNRFDKHVSDKSKNYPVGDEVYKKESNKKIKANFKISSTIDFRFENPYILLVLT